MAARTLSKLARAGSGTRDRYSSMLFGAAFPFAEMAFFIQSEPAGSFTRVYRSDSNQLCESSRVGAVT